MERSIRSRHRPTKVLVVEDEIFVALDIETLLLKQGYSVLGPASSIDQALRLLDEGLPDLALLDFSLRGEDVIPVVERLRLSGIPIVLTSAYEAERMGRFDALEGAFFVQKPFRDQDLLHALISADSTGMQI